MGSLPHHGNFCVVSDFDDDDDVGLHVLGCRVDILILKTRVLLVLATQ